MTGYQFPATLQKLVKHHMDTGNYSSEDDLLLDALHALAERNETLAAIHAGIEDMEAGRVFRFEEVAQEIQQEHGFSSDQ